MSSTTAPYRAQLIALVLSSYLFISICFFGSLLIQILILAVLPIGWFFAASYLLGREQRQTEIERVKAVKEERRADAEKRRADSRDLRAQKIDEAFKDRIGYHVGALEIEVDILNYVGDCNTIWVWKDIVKVRPESLLSYIPGHLEFYTQGCSFSQYPQLLPNYSETHELELTHTSARRCEFQIHAQKETPDSNYGYSASVVKAFCITEEGLIDQPFDYESFGYMVKSVIDRFALTIIFPAHYHPDNLQHDVSIGWVPGEIRDELERDRITVKEGIENNRRYIIISIEKPMIGYFYFIRWNPLPDAVVHGIKRREYSLEPI